MKNIILILLCLIPAFVFSQKITTGTQFNIDSVRVVSNTSGITVKVNNVSSLPTKILPSSISSTGAMTGNIIKFDGTNWVLANETVPDGSETKINSGTGIIISGIGTIGNPYLVEADTSFLATQHDLTQIPTGIDTFRVAGSNLELSLENDGVPAYTVPVTDIAPIQGLTAGTGIALSGLPNITITNTGVLGNITATQVGYGDVSNNLTSDVYLRKTTQSTVVRQYDDPSLGANNITNGTFDDASGWTLGTGWSISGGNAFFTGGVVGTLSRSIIMSANTYYIEFVYTTAPTTGSITCTIGSVAVPFSTIQQAHSVYYPAAGTTTISLTPSSTWNGVINAINIWTVVPSNSLISFEDPTGTEVASIRTHSAAEKSFYLGIDAGKCIRNTTVPGWGGSGSSIFILGPNSLQKAGNVNSSTIIGPKNGLWMGEASNLTIIGASNITSQNAISADNMTILGNSNLSGNYSTSTKIGGNSIIIGNSNFTSPNITSSVQNAIIIGNNIGQNVTTATSLISIGPSSSNSLTTGGNYSIHIGRGAGNGITTGVNNTIIGSGDAGNLTNVSNTIHITAGGGYQTNNASNTPAASHVFIGGGYTPVFREYYFGFAPFTSVGGASTSHLRINAPSGLGTDIGGGNFQIAAGRGTGAGIGGDVILQTSSALASGTTTQNLSDRLIVKYNTGDVLIGSTSDLAKIYVRGNGTTTGNLLKLDDGAGTQRVLVQDNGTLTFGTYPNTLNSSGNPVNVLSTSSAGVVESHPISEVISAAGAVTGSGTLNYIPKWTPDGTTLGNSIIQDNGTNAGIGGLNVQTPWNVLVNSTITSGAQYGQILSTTVNPPTASSALNTAFRNYMVLTGSANMSTQNIATSSVINDLNTGTKTTTSGTDIFITSNGGTTTTMNGQLVTLAVGPFPVTANIMRGYSSVLKGSATTGSCFYGRAETYYTTTPTNFRIFDADLSSVVSATTANPYGFYQSGNPSGAKNYMQSLLGLNNLTPTAQLHVKGQTSLSGSYNFIAEKGDGTDIIVSENNGDVYLPLLSGTGTRLMSLSSTGLLGRSSIDPATIPSAAGTAGFFPVFTGLNTLGNSATLQQSGTTLVANYASGVWLRNSTIGLVTDFVGGNVRLYSGVGPTYNSNSGELILQPLNGVLRIGTTVDSTSSKVVIKSLSGAAGLNVESNAGSSILKMYDNGRLAVNLGSTTPTNNLQVLGSALIDYTSGADYARMAVNSSTAAFLSNNITIGVQALGTGGLIMSTENMAIEADEVAGTFKVTDNTTTAAGLEYAADYSANYTSRSLVDKAYVLSVAGGSPDLTFGGVTDAVTLTAGGTPVTFIAGTGITITTSGGNLSAITNTGDTNAADDVTTTTPHAGEVTGVYNNLEVADGVIDYPNVKKVAPIQKTANFTPSLTDATNVYTTDISTGAITMTLPEISATPTGSQVPPGYIVSFAPLNTSATNNVVTLTGSDVLYSGAVTYNSGSPFTATGRQTWRFIAVAPGYWMFYQGF